MHPPTPHPPHPPHGHEKPILRGDCLKQEGLGHFADLRRGLTRKMGVVFLRGGRYPNAHYVTRMLLCYLLRNQSKKWSKSDIGPLNIRSACLKELYVLLGKQLLIGHGTVASHQLYLDMIPSQGFSCYLTKEKYVMLMSRTFFIISTAFVLEFWICDICYALYVLLYKNTAFIYVRIFFPLKRNYLFWILYDFAYD